jgi:hypothetical protein
MICDEKASLAKARPAMPFGRGRGSGAVSPNKHFVLPHQQ